MFAPNSTLLSRLMKNRGVIVAHSLIITTFVIKCRRGGGYVRSGCGKRENWRALRLGVSQTHLTLIEDGKRRAPEKLAVNAVRVYENRSKRTTATDQKSGS